MVDNIEKVIKGNRVLFGIAMFLKSLITPTSQRSITRIVLKYNLKRFKKYSGAFRQSKISEVSYLTWLYHVIEKGLAMPEMRLGFGHDKIIKLDKKITQFISLYGEKKQALDAIEVLLEYERVHVEACYQLPQDICEIVNKWKSKYPLLKPVLQSVCTKDVFWENINSDFPRFMKSRHSVRHFSGTISEQQIIDAIELARFAPSACNRQPARVHIVSDKKLQEKCLALQNGNRGFGNLADKLLVVTGDLSTVLGGQEFFDLGTNVGIFIMNLSYGLHYNKVAHCILNWYALPKQDRALRKILNIPDEETVFAYIVCGNLPEAFKVVASPRIDADEIYTIHN